MLGMRNGFCGELGGWSARQHREGFSRSGDTRGIFYLLYMYRAASKPRLDFISHCLSAVRRCLR